MAIQEEGLYTDKARDLGEIAENRSAEQALSRAAEGAIGFGRAVVEGTKPIEQVKLISGASDVFVGVAAKSFEASDLDNEAYADEDAVGVVTEGVIIVKVEEAVDPTSPVRVRHTDGTGTYAGDFGTTAEAGKTALLSDAKFLGTVTAAGRVALELGKQRTLTADT